MGCATKISADTVIRLHLSRNFYVQLCMFIKSVSSNLQIIKMIKLENKDESLLNNLEWRRDKEIPL